MTQRLQIATVQPDALTAMLGLENYLSKVELAKEYKELIKLKASMINKCAYCIQMHTQEALDIGMPQQKLFAIAAWAESPLFTERERALLALTEEMTLISDKGLSDATYQECVALLGEELVAEAMMQVIMINAWNRFALATKMTH
ncbi:carboxymuconolactone decarboxylase family protein [Vibrio rotiferianus]|uniref:carboxymuconolactone decarboxylase family protein n=1 Tax=Vibrio rotiferianus TaxID=190895 RepID=UPI00390C144D